MLEKESNSIPKAFFATILYIIGIELLSTWVLIPNLFESNYLINFYPLIQGTLQFIGVLIVIYFIQHKTLNSTINKTNFNWYANAFILGLSFVFVQTPLNWVYNILSSNNYQILYDFDGFHNLTNINVISIILLIPIGEELIFRKYIQGNLLKNNNIYFAILLSSVLFALIHSPYLNLIFSSLNLTWHQCYITFFGGLIAGVIFFKSKSVGPCIVFHIGWNLFITIL